MNIKLAEQFGKMMGKRAAEGLNSAKSSPGFYAGGPHNRVGALPSATTKPSVPDISVGRGIPKTVDRHSLLMKGHRSFNKPYLNFLDRNYSSSSDEFGTSRLKFHKDLGQQLDQSGGDNAWKQWEDRMGQLADQTRSSAPIRHAEFTSLEPTNLARRAGIPPNMYSQIFNKSTAPNATPIYLPKPADYSPTAVLNNILRGNFNRLPYALDIQNKLKDFSRAARDVSLHSYTKDPTNYENVIRFENNIPSFTPPNQLVQASFAPRNYGQGISTVPRSLQNNATRLHEATHAGHQNMDYALQTNQKGQPYKALFNDMTDRLGQNSIDNFVRRPVAAESGAVFNEIGQSARAYKDVTGKPLKGVYEFAPNVEMDYSELGDLAKKYKPADLNSPAGQLWLRRILESSK